MGRGWGSEASKKQEAKPRSLLSFSTQTLGRKRPQLKLHQETFARGHTQAASGDSCKGPHSSCIRRPSQGGTLELPHETLARGHSQAASGDTLRGAASAGHVSVEAAGNGFCYGVNLPLPAAVRSWQHLGDGDRLGEAETHMKPCQGLCVLSLLCWRCKF